MSDLRPTLFLAQLSNLLAGNISIVHGVTGSSRTFMGEERPASTRCASRIARIAAGQSDIALVGGAYNAERWEVMLHFALGGGSARGEPKPVWERATGMAARLHRGVPGAGGKEPRRGARRQAARAARRGRCPIT